MHADPLRSQLLPLETARSEQRSELGSRENRIAMCGWSLQGVPNERTRRSCRSPPLRFSAAHRHATTPLGATATGPRWGRRRSGHGRVWHRADLANPWSRSTGRPMCRRKVTLDG